MSCVRSALSIARTTLRPFSLLSSPSAASALGLTSFMSTNVPSLPDDASVYKDKTPPHGGGKLVNLFASSSSSPSSLLASATHTLNLSDRNACDVELLSTGAFTPLTGFMDEETYKSVVETMRLPSSASTPSLLFPLPIVLDTNDDSIRPGSVVALHYQSKPIAVMEVNSVYTPDKAYETKMCYGTSSLEHPGTLMVATERGRHYLGGPLTAIDLPNRPFPCLTPAAVRALLPPATDVLAFQCRNPVHRAHYEAVVLVHPTVGPTQGDDISGAVRYQTYKVLEDELNADGRGEKILWQYLPYSMHMAGPREALQHMLVRKNYGCTHFIIGRDMAGSKSSIDGEDFYGAFEAQDMAKQYSSELGVDTVPSSNVVFTTELGYITAEEAKEKDIKPQKLSGTEFRRRLRGGEEIPEWFAFPSVVKVLRKHV